MEFKYIVIESGIKENIIIFDKGIRHDEMAFKFNAAKVVGAGFINWNDKDDEGNPVPQCYGESSSLKIKSRPEDTRLAVLFYTH